MKEHYKYIHFVEIERRPQMLKANMWACMSNKKENLELGTVEWYEPWKQYCFCPNPDDCLVFNTGCMEDIIDFIKQCGGKREKEET